MAQRLAHWLNRAIDAGRAAPGSANDGEEGAGEMDFDERPRACKAALVEHAAVVGEMPDDGVVTAEQAESALGKTLATEIDQDMLDALDPDTKEEEDALAGRHVNPPGVAYSSICWQSVAPDSVGAVTVGWRHAHYTILSLSISLTMPARAVSITYRTRGRLSLAWRLCGKAAQRSSYLFHYAQNAFDINLPPEPYGLC